MDDRGAGARVYREIKAAILTGAFHLRQRLDIEPLAARFGVSATPVRQALAILAGERLVIAGGARGYRVAFWGEAQLRALYVWRGELAELAAQSYAPRSFVRDDADEASHERLFIAVMTHLSAQAHDEIRHASENADDRLRAALRAEPEALAQTQSELAGLADALEAGRERALKRRLRRYFQRRAEHARLIRAAAHALAIPSNGE